MATLLVIIVDCLSMVRSVDWAKGKEKKRRRDERMGKKKGRLTGDYSIERKSLGGNFVK